MKYRSVISQLLLGLSIKNSKVLWEIQHKFMTNNNVLNSCCSHQNSSILPNEFQWLSLFWFFAIYFYKWNSKPNTWKIKEYQFFVNFTSKTDLTWNWYDYLSLNRNLKLLEKLKKFHRPWHRTVYDVVNRFIIKTYHIWSNISTEI